MNLPKDLDDQSLRRLARSFYVVRMARYAGLLVATVAIVVLSAATGAPGWVAAVMAALAAAFVVAMVVTRHRYVRSTRSPSASSRSPTG